MLALSTSVHEVSLLPHARSQTTERTVLLLERPCLKCGMGQQARQQRMPCHRNEEHRQHLRLRQELEHHARRHTPGIRHDGIRKVLEGATTLEEVVRVTYED